MWRFSGEGIDCEKQPNDEAVRPKVIQIFFCVVVRLPLMRTPLQPLGKDIFEYLWNLADALQKQAYA